MYDSVYDMYESCKTGEICCRCGRGVLGGSVTALRVGSELLLLW